MDSNIQNIIDSTGRLQATLDINAQQLAALTRRVNATVHDFLEERTWNVAKGTVANTGATGSTQTGAQTLPGASYGTFSIAPDGPWADRYNYLKFTPDPAISNYLYELSVMFPTVPDTAAVNCLELDIQQVISHKVYNAGLQFDFGDGFWRIWNRSATPRDWVSTGSPIKRFAPLTWTHVVFEAHRDEGNIYSDLALFNGTGIAGAAMKFPATTETDQPDMMNIGFQLDSNGKATPFRVAVNRMRFTTW